MNKKKVVWKILAILCALIFTQSATATFLPKTETKVINTGKTGIVDISLAEYRINETGDYELFTGTVSVLPGQTVSKIPIITNEGMDCYLRVALEISMAEGYEHLTPITLNEISGIDLNKWMYRDGYFYYTEVLKEQEYVKFFDAVHIPATWDNAYVLSKFDISITAEAIQAENFKPDYEAEQPWGDTPIEAAIKEDDDVRKPLAEPELNLHFLNDSKKLVASESNFFTGFGTLMPGDVITRTVTLTSDAKDAEIFFKTEPDMAVADFDMLERIGLMIKSNEETLYVGNLAAAGTENYVSLGVVGRDNDGTLVFEISVPAELDNVYTLSDLSVEWWLGATWEVDEETPPVVGTGDTELSKYVTCMVISALGMIIFLLIGKRKEAKNEEKIG